MGAPHVRRRPRAAVADVRLGGELRRRDPERRCRCSPGSPPLARRRALEAPTLFLLGFLFIFVLGGLTGVMVAVLPFDWQVHDTYFVVAHLHYVLIGGMVFPLFAALLRLGCRWSTGTPRRSALGRWVFGLMFVGFNMAFFPMHVPA